MTQISTTAAYVRKAVSASHIRAPESFDVQLLELLETPHTVESLTRVIARDAESAPEDDDLSHRITWSMRRLLEDDLIELSPDS